MARLPGQHARAQMRLVAWRWLGVLGGIVVVTALSAWVLGWRSPAFVAVELAGLAGLAAIARWGMPAIDRWDRGATGEEHVGAIMEELDGWRALHDVATGRGNIDHVLVGPGGLYTVETKSHPGRIQAGRVDRRMLAQAYAEAKHLERLTGRPVQALLVFSRAWVDPWASRRRGVWVLSARMLPRFLRRAPRRLTPAEVDAVHASLVAGLEDAA